MRTFCRSITVPMLASAALLVAGPPVLAQIVELVTVDVKAVAQGYRASKLSGKDVVNSKNEAIGEIDDFVIGRDDHALFVVLQVGGFLGVGGHLVALPFDNLAIEGAGDKITLAGGTRDALNDLPEFEYQEN